MAGPEARVWASMRKSLPPKTHSTRIENRHGGGIPDVHLLWDGVAIWVELKVHNSRAVFLRPSQAAWHSRQAHCGGVSYVLCGCTTSPKVRIFRGSEAALRASEGLLCVPPLIAVDSMTEALRLLRLDALRHMSEVCSAAPRSPAT